jgi:sigma-B regulation protein RsbU (phosphoserine phosphatase)
MAAVPAATSRLPTRAPAYFCLAALFLISVTHFARDAFDRIDAVRHASQYVREPFYLGDANWGAVFLQPEAEAAGMKYADAVLAVNGRPVDGFIVYYGALRKARVGDRLRVQVQSPADPVVKDLSIELRAYSSNRTAAGFSAYVASALSGVALPAVCIALGFWVAAARIGDPSAWLLLVVLLSLAAFIGGGSGPQGIFGQENILQPLFAGFHAFLSLIAAPALMLFGIAFPERLAIDRRFPWLKWIVVGHLALVSTLEGINVGLWVHHLPLARGVQSAVELLTGRSGDFGAAVSFVALIVCVGSLGYKTVTESSRDARRRLLLLDLGAGISIAALLAILVVNRLEARLPDWSLFPLIAMMLAFPLTMAYVIVVHRAMDVRVVIRQGVQYLFARGGIRAIQLALTVAVTIAATSLLSGGAGPLRVALVVAGMAAIVAIGGRFADRVRAWVDRRFFREAYEADAILSDLATRVRTMVEIGPLLETVAGRIAESLHVPQIAILLNERGAFRPAYSLGYAAPPRTSIPEHSLTLKRLRQQQHALVVFDDADSWVQLTDGEERASLEELRPELLLPLSLNEKVLGIMSLGRKQSEEPFSKTDIRLLDSVAAQTGLALENGRLTEAIKAEVAVREKHNRELEIAHEVQERLFPQEYPSIAGLEYAGACRPALGVGGDYYDFIPLSKTELGIAIGDVSGKGIPAALLMATLRAYVRGQTIQHKTDLTEVMANLNKLVYESSAANRYATFFYAELDAASRALSYVNAGHNPPMVFRQAHRGDEVMRLDAGGPVIGLMEDCCYRQGRIALEAGDVLVAYTDGISEAMNAADDEWGEERLMDAVRANPIVAARALIERLMTSADAFVAGAPQHDDMTLVVVRVI